MAKKNEKEFNSFNSSLFNFENKSIEKTTPTLEKKCEHTKMYDALVNDFTSLKWGWGDHDVVIKCPECKQRVMLACNRDEDCHRIHVYRRDVFIKLTVNDEYIGTCPYKEDKEDVIVENEEKPEEEESDEE